MTLKNSLFPILVAAAAAATFVTGVVLHESRLQGPSGFAAAAVFCVAFAVASALALLVFVPLYSAIGFLGKKPVVLGSLVLLAVVAIIEASMSGSIAEGLLILGPLVSGEWLIFASLMAMAERS